MQRIIETAALAGGADAYGLVEYMDDVRGGVWSELSSASPVDTYRRNLQRGYLDRMDWLMNEDYSVSGNLARFYTAVNVEQSDIRPVARAQLTTIRRDAARAAQRTRDTMTRLHLLDVVERIDDVLDVD